MSDSRALMRSGVLLAARSICCVLAVALLVAVLGRAGALREQFGFRFPSAAASLSEVASIWMQNAQLAALVLLAAVALLALRGHPHAAWLARFCCDAVLALLLALNLLLIGLALGAYGTRLAAQLALHGPVELAGFAIAGAGYLAARVGALGYLGLLRLAALCAAVLALAALLESYVALGAT